MLNNDFVGAGHGEVDEGPLRGLDASAHGNHYGREAIGVLRGWATEHLEFERLIYPVDRRNISSRKIAEELGGAIIAEKKVMTMGGFELDEVVYGIPPERQSTGFVPPSLPVGEFLLRPFRQDDAMAWYSYR